MEADYFQSFPKSHISQTMFHKIIIIPMRKKPNEA